jgi:hypothetical protein
LLGVMSLYGVISLHCVSLHCLASVPYTLMLRPPLPSSLSRASAGWYPPAALLSLPPSLPPRPPPSLPRSRPSEAFSLSLSLHVRDSPPSSGHGAGFCGLSGSPVVALEPSLQGTMACPHHYVVVCSSPAYHYHSTGRVTRLRHVTSGPHLGTRAAYRNPGEEGG